MNNSLFRLFFGIQCTDQGLLKGILRELGHEFARVQLSYRIVHLPSDGRPSQRRLLRFDPTPKPIALVCVSRGLIEDWSQTLTMDTTPTNLSRAAKIYLGQARRSKFDLLLAIDNVSFKQHELIRYETECSALAHRFMVLSEQQPLFSLIQAVKANTALFLEEVKTWPREALEPTPH